MPGSARSASVIASPHVGQATQAIDQRRTSLISCDSFTPMAVEDLFDALAARRLAGR